MADIEEQLQRLAGHRAAQLRPYEAPRVFPVARTWRHGRVLAAAAACFVVLAVAAGWAGWTVLRDDDQVASVSPTTDGVAPTTGVPPTTGAPVACARAGSTERQQGTGVLSTPPKPSVLATVDVQTSTCVDEVSFGFANGIPDWTIEYRDGPFTDSPRGEPVSVDGRAFLVLRMEHAAGADLTSANPRRLYPGPLSFQPGPPSEIRQLVQLEDFESQLVWVIGLDARKLFTVAIRLNKLVITIQTQSSTRDMTCSEAPRHFRVRVPDGVFVSLAPDLHCRFFGTSPFHVTRGSDAPVPISISVEAPAQTEHFAVGLSSRGTTIDGRTARVLEGEYNGLGLAPAGTRFYYYEIAWGSGVVLRIYTDGEGGGNHDANKAAVDALAASARYVS